MKNKNRLLNLKLLKRRKLSVKIFSSLFIIGFIFFSAENKVFGQVVNFFTCSPYSTANYCRHTTFNSTASATANFQCSNWKLTYFAFVNYSNDTTCENGSPITNVSQVGRFTNYVNAYGESDSWEPVLRTVTTFAFFCNMTTTPIWTEYYEEGCIDDDPTGGGGCRSGFTKTGEAFKVEYGMERCSPCSPSQLELNECQQQGGIYDYSSCQCGQSPIVIDVSGNGFNLTNAANGVAFDINGNGTLDQLSWTSADSDDAWLVLDRNNNNLIDDGTELFGSHTSQPVPPSGVPRNGFLALAEFDKPANGGNNDGEISAQDSVFFDLHLWQDVNHNGISEPNELKLISEVGLAKLDLDYRESRRTDEYGNKFKYRAKVKNAQGVQGGRWAWDVYLVVQQP